jgi:hypothetical protein
LGRVKNPDLLMKRRGGNAGTAPEAFPKDTKMPRRASTSMEVSQVASPMPSITALTPSPPVISITFGTRSTEE